MKEELHYLLMALAEEMFTNATRQQGGNSETRAAYYAGLAVGQARAARRVAEAAQDYPAAKQATELAENIHDWWLQDS